MDSDLEAFGRNPSDDSFVVLAFELATWLTLNPVVLSFKTSLAYGLEVEGFRASGGGDGDKGSKP